MGFHRKGALELFCLLLIFAVQLSCSLRVNVWTNVTAPTFIYPEVSDTGYGIQELKEKASLGIAFSGGGLRAAPFTYGVLRALYLMNITSKARYISANSGGTWVAAPFSYTTAPMSRFFSPYYEPQNLTVSKLSSSPSGSWAAAVAGKSLVPGMVGDPTLLPGEPSAWAVNVARIFLQPFGVASPDSTTSADGTKGDILAATKRKLPLMAVNVACKDSRPYPILVGAIMVPDDVSPKFYPYEFTPLYSGMPAVAEKSKPIPLGGGYIEPFGLHSLPPGNKVVSPIGNETVNIIPLRIKTVSSVMHAVGISSSAIALMTKQSNILLANLFNGQMLNYWNQWNYKQRLLSFLDGGAADDLALMPQLRRGVKNIIVCLASHTHPDTSMEDFAKSEFALAGLFGAVPVNATDDNGKPLLLHGTDTAKTWNEMQQVFPKEGFADLFVQYKASYKAGGPHIFNNTYQVLPNAFFGVNGGYNVNILWVLNGKSSNWEAALPLETQRWIDSKRAATGPYKSYPNVYNVMQAPAELISLLSQQASWSLRVEKDLVRDWVAAAKP